MPHLISEQLEVRFFLTCLLEANTCFAVIGDFGDAGTEERDVANLVKGWNPDLIITTGDNNYPDGEASTIDENVGQYYHDFIFAYSGIYGDGSDTNRFFPSLGNHDWRAPGAQPYLDYFTLPGNERYYNFSWGPVDFFAVDSDSNEPDGNTSDSVQAAWLQSALAESTATWKLVYMHHAPYSSGERHGSQTKLQWPYHEWGATAVFAGHDHNYERIVRDGILYFVNGLGGNGTSGFTSPIPGSEVRYDGDVGAMLVDANDSRITFQFISRAGETVDIHSISTVAEVPTVSVTSTNVFAAESETRPGSFTVNRTGDVSDELTVSYTLDGTAINGVDFERLNGSVTIPGGADSASVFIRPIDDILAESSESLTIELSLSTAYNIATPTADTLTIVDDDVSGSLQIVESRVAASTDDAEELESGRVRLTSSDLELVVDDGDQTVGMRFGNVAIPRGAKVVRAHIQFQVDESSSKPTSLSIRGEATDHALPFASSADNISSRNMTAASKAWSPLPWRDDGDVGEDQRTPNLAEIIQEIVDRPGWSSDNSLAIIVSGSGERVAESYDGDESSAPLLHVEYVDEAGTAINVPPSLEPIDDKSVSPPHELSFIVAATSPEPTALVFTLDPGAPRGTSIDRTTGLFRWTPNDETDPGRYPITVRVTDGLNPNLSDATEFTITVGETTGATIPAFPGAEGYGAASVGGRGGRIIEVTNLNDGGPGSLRAAVESEGPRIVVFRVAGIIELESPIRVKQQHSFLTIAGQTAPGGGITLKGTDSNLLHVQSGAHDIIIRYLRLRNGSGIADGDGHDNLNIYGGHDIIVDHVSMSWASDENAALHRNGSNPPIRNVTIQRSIMSEGLSGHSNGLLIGGTTNNSNPDNPVELWRDVHNISVHHNLFAHNSHRNPRVTSRGTEAINNVMYNWRARVGSTARDSVFDFVNNFAEFGPFRQEEIRNDRDYAEGLILHHEHQSRDGKNQYDDASIYSVGNIVEPDFLTDPTSDNWKLWSLNHSEPKFQPLPDRFRRHTPLPPGDFPVKTQSAIEAYDDVMANVGSNARVDCLGRLVSNADTVDRRVITEVVTKKGPDSPISSPDDVGGYPVIDPGTPCQDSDHDGMPNEWEVLRGFNPHDPTDGLLDADGNGYTNVEDYLNATPLTVPNQPPDLDLDQSQNVVPIGTSCEGINVGLQPGDADRDLDFDQRDLVMVLSAGKYLAEQPATWCEGDWYRGPSRDSVNAAGGDGVFDHFDIIAALQSGLYLSGRYAAN